MAQPQPQYSSSLPEPPQMLSAIGSADPTGALMVEISKGLQGHIHAGMQRSMQRREVLAQRFEQLAQDPNYIARQDIVTQARRYAAMLRMLPPTEKMPKEFEADKKTGAIPAYDGLVLQAHHSARASLPTAPAPAQAAPAQAMPTMEAGAQGTDFDAMFPPSGGGGISKGPNAISPNPTLPTPPTAIAQGQAQDGSAPNSMLPDGMEPTGDPLGAAAYRAQIANIENSIDLPGMGNVNKNALPFLKTQQTAAVAMRKLGLNPDGTPIDKTSLTPTEQAKIDHMQAQDALFDARVDLSNANKQLAHARAAGIPQQIAVAMQNAATARGKLGIMQQDADTRRMRVGLDASLYGLDSGAGAGAAGGAEGTGGPEDMLNDYHVSQTVSGALYVDLTGYTGKMKNQLKNRYESQGVTALDGPRAKAISDLDGARLNQDSVLNSIFDKLPKDAGGRITGGLQNTVEQLLQTDDEIAAFNSWRTTAIRTLRAAAGSEGLRINEAEIVLAVANDIPKITDTIGAARQKARNIRAQLDNVEKSILVPRRAGMRGSRGEDDYSDAAVKLPQPPAPAPGTTPPGSTKATHRYNPATGRIEPVGQP